MESEEGTDSNDGAASTGEIDDWGDELGTEGKHKTPEHFGDQEREASKDELTPKYLVDKASEKVKIWVWLRGPFGYEGPAWLLLILFTLGLIAVGIAAL
jgi:hypothetical protein